MSCARYQKLSHSRKEFRIEENIFARGTSYVGIKDSTIYSFFVKPAVLSLAGGRERGRDVSFREEKIQKEEIFREGPMTEGHLSESSFLDLRGHFSILIQMREIGTKQIF